MLLAWPGVPRWAVVVGLVRKGGPMRSHCMTSGTPVGAPTLFRAPPCKLTPPLQAAAPALAEEEATPEELRTEYEAELRKVDRAKTRAERRMRRPLEQQFSHTRTYQP